MYDENTGIVIWASYFGYRDMRQNVYSGHDVYDCSSSFLTCVWLGRHRAPTDSGVQLVWYYWHAAFMAAVQQQQDCMEGGTFLSASLGVLFEGSTTAIRGEEVEK